MLSQIHARAFCIVDFLRVIVVSYVYMLDAEHVIESGNTAGVVTYIVVNNSSEVNEITIL